MSGNGTGTGNPNDPNYVVSQMFPGLTNYLTPASVSTAPNTTAMENYAQNMQQALTQANAANQSAQASSNYQVPLPPPQTSATLPPMPQQQAQPIQNFFQNNPQLQAGNEQVANLSNLLKHAHGGLIYAQ